ncbi:MAG: DNRLRE domain-containing protein, partial [Bacteroidota bacterium]
MNKNIYRTLSLLMAISLTFGKFTFGQAKSNLATTASTFVTEADSRVHEANPDTNYGTYGTVLYVEGGTDPDIESNFKFTVTGVSGTVTNAKLRVYVTQGTVDGPAVYTTGNDWTEKGITWTNRPARTSGALDDKGSLANDTWAEFDVTKVIPGNGTYSFVLATNSTDSLSLSSREGSNPAQLVVSFSDGSTNTPLPSPTQAPTQAAASPTPTTQVVASPTPTTQVTLPTSTPVSGSTALPTATPIKPTATPTTVLPTATPIKPTATPTTAATNPTATPTQPSSSSTTYTSGSMWISASELMSLPTSGTAWDKMRTTAYGSWGTPDLKNQDNKHAINTLAGALVFARTGDATLRSKVRDAIIAAKRTIDESSEWQTTNGVLAAGRQIGAYVISADLIGLKSFDSGADNEFR